MKSQIQNPKSQRNKGKTAGEPPDAAPTMRLTIDGRAVEARGGETILDAAGRAGIAIPTLCHDGKLEPYASCWLCVVKVKGERRFRPACSTLAAAGMEVITLDDDIRLARRLCLELLLSDHCGECVPPCRLACPSGCDARGYLRLITEKRYGEAMGLIRETVPMPATIGRICPHPCEESCRRGVVDEPASICALKRFVAEKAEGAAPPPRKPPTGKRVAVVGSGPAGLSAAWFLALEGHAVTVFEARGKPGGMLRFGIPEYRLPKAVLDAEIDAVRALGVELRCGVRVGAALTVPALRAQGYDTVLLAGGAQRSRMMGIPGEALPGVLGGIDFLADVAGGAHPELGTDVIVVGGGDTAIDAARTALRLGAKRVTILYRRSREEMPATAAEIAAAEEEGIVIRYLTLPAGIRRAGGRLEVDCTKMALGAPDESGRRKPVPVEGSLHSIGSDTVIMAIGQSVDPSLLDASGIAPGKGGVIPADEGTLETGRAGVFAAGDCVTGPDIAIGAVAAGRRAAHAIDSFLRTGAASPLPPLFSPARRKIEEVSPGEYAGEEKLARMGACHLAPAARKGDFREVERTAGEEDALREAYRCLDCGCDKADDCALRDLAREYGAEGNRFGAPAKRWRNDDRHPYIVRDPDKCIKCARCIRVCLEVQGIGAWGYIGRGLEVQVAPPFGRPLQDTDCESCGQCLTACPTGALMDKGLRPSAAAAPSPPVETTCGHCGDGCGVAVSTSGNCVSRVSPRGNANLCEKGRFGCGYLGDAERVFSPAVRRGRKFTAAGWDEAAVATREGLSGAKGRGIAVFVSPRLTDAESYEAQRIARAVLGTNNIHPAAGAVFSPEPFRRLGRIVSPQSAGDVGESDAVVVAGAGIVGSNRVAALSVIAAARRGARVLLVGQERTKFDRIATERLRVPPDRFAAYGATAAAFLRGARSPAIVFNRDAVGDRALLALHRLAKKSGAVIVSLCAEANGQGLLDAGVSPFVLPGQKAVSNARARRVLEKEWGCRLPAWRGLGRKELLSAMRGGRIRAAIFLGPAPEDDRELAAELRKVTFILMQALRPSPLTRLAHILLPAASWAESRGTFTRCDGAKLDVRPVFPPLCGYTNAEIWRLLFPLNPTS